MLDVRIKGANDLRHMADLLRIAHREDLGRRLGKAVKTAGETTLSDLKKSAENIHTRGIRKPDAKHPFIHAVPPKGTRRRIAGSAEIRVSVLSDNPRVQFRIGRGLEDLANLPRRLDEPGTFRHPIMGNREAWVAQTGDPYFWRPIRDNLDTFRARIDEALDETRQMLETA
jgi:hypothetical protein